MNKNTSNRCISAAFAVVIAVVMFLSTTISVSAVSEDYTEPSASVNQTQEHHTIDTAAMDAEREAASRAFEAEIESGWAESLEKSSQNQAQFDEQVSQKREEFEAKQQEVQEFAETVEPIVTQSAKMLNSPIVSGLFSLAGSVWGILFLIFIGILFSILFACSAKELTIKRTKKKRIQSSLLKKMHPKHLLRSLLRAPSLRKMKTLPRQV